MTRNKEFRRDGQFFNWLSLELKLELEIEKQNSLELELVMDKQTGLELALEVELCKLTAWTRTKTRTKRTDDSIGHIRQKGKGF